MTNAKTREEFEKWANSKSIPVIRCETAEQCYAIFETDLTWQAWQASRENIEVELPAKDIASCDFDIGYNIALAAVEQKLTEQGFKVK